MGNPTSDSLAEYDRRQAGPPKRVSVYEANKAAEAAGLKMKEQRFEMDRETHDLNKARVESDLEWEKFTRDEEHKARSESAQAIRELSTLKGTEPHFQEALADIYTRLPAGTRDPRFDRVVASKTSVYDRQRELVEKAEASAGVSVPRGKDGSLDWKGFYDARRAKQSELQAAAVPPGMKPTAAQISPDGDVSLGFQAEKTPLELSRDVLAKGINPEQVKAALASKDPLSEISSLVGSHVNENLLLKQQQTAMRSRISAASAILKNPESTPAQKTAALATLDEGVGAAEDPEDAALKKLLGGK